MNFADSSFWVGAFNSRDDHHDEAVALWRMHADTGLVTTNHVRGESWIVLRRRAGHHVATRFLDGLDAARRVTVVHVDPVLEEEALRWLRRHDEREYSFVDATSFAVMRDLRLREALAFDGDFSANGFVELRAPTR